MRIGLTSGDIAKSNNDAILFLTQEQLKAFKKSSKPVLYDLVEDSLEQLSFKGKLGDIEVVPTKLGRVIVTGLGKEEKLTVETLRRAAHVALRTTSKMKIKAISAAVPDVSLTEKETVRALSDGFRLSNYEFDQHKSEKDSKYNRVAEVKIHINKLNKELEKTLLYSKVSCDATNLTRDLQTEDGDVINSEYLAKFAQKLAKSHKLKLKLLNRAKLKKEGLNLILGVGQGSRFEPHLIILEYNGDKRSKEKTAIVGKGITYDTGGLDIKVRWMADMQMDMSGAAIVLATIKAAAELKLKKNIIAVAPVVENAVGQSAQKPGCIVKSYSGKTVEIGNTDAEGRLALADALAYVNKNYKPTRMIDLATLTGAVVVALGHNRAGAWSTDEEMMFKLKAAAETSGDLIWEMPLEDDYEEYLKSKKADTNNISSYRTFMGLAGSTTAALFLRKFVKDTPWAHIDIAGAGMFEKRRFYRPPNGTGFGVRLLLDYFNQK